MIYLIILYEYFMIGLFAVGGGLVVIPFLFDLGEKYGWYSPQELTDMYAISQSLPGLIGINAGVFTGLTAGGVLGGILAAIGLVLPAFITIILLAKYLNKYYENSIVQNSLYGIRPATIALIGFAAYKIAVLSIFDLKTGLMFIGSFLIMPFIQKHMIPFIFLAGVMGILLKI